QLLKSKVLKEYGLDKEFKVVDGSTPAMLAELKRAYAKKEPIATTLWSPHWAYNEFDLTKLKDPKGAWGEGDEIHTLARKGFSKEFPEVGKWLKDFKMGRGHRLHFPVEGDAGAARFQGERPAVRGGCLVHGYGQR
ncbi:glycine betaine ABC transporter substrate-binding protein, partial [Streptomyces albidoflavus]